MCYEDCRECERPRKRLSISTQVFLDPFATKALREENERLTATVQHLEGRIRAERERHAEVVQKILTEELRGAPLPHQTRHVRVFCTCGREMLPCPTDDELEAAWAHYRLEGGEKPPDWSLFNSSERQDVYGKDEDGSAFHRAGAAKVVFYCPVILNEDHVESHYEHEEVVMWVRDRSYLTGEEEPVVFGPDKRSYKSGKEDGR